MASITKTAYQILGVSEQAKHKDIKGAYKKMALRSHPDKNPNDPQAKSTFQMVSEAYETLGDAHRRFIYDAKLRSQRGGPVFFGGPRTQPNAFDGGSKIPSWAPPRRPTYAYDRSSGFQQYWQNGKDRPPTPDPRPSWNGNVPPNGGPNGRYTQDEWQEYTPPSPDWDPTWVKERQEHAERLKRMREEHEARKTAAQDERHKMQWHLRQKELLSEILGLDNAVAELERETTRTKHTGGRHSPGVDSDAREVCDKEIRLNSRRRKLQYSLGKHASICKLQRKRGWAKQAEQAETKLAEARTEGYQARAKEQIRGKDLKTCSDERGRNRKPVNKEGLHFEEDQQKGEPGPGQQGKPDPKAADTRKETGSQAHLREWLAKLEHPNMHLWFDPNTSRPSPPPPYPASTTSETDPEPLIPDLKPSAPTAARSSTREVDPLTDDPHLSHLEVHRGFWEFAPGEQKCVVCLEEGAVLQCPMCIKMFCGVCKGSYVEDSVPVGTPDWAGRR
ncbi:hypothetical protein N7G274_008592 [Stereocaulon virgatum]|uniref:J domain-containing protein n=1 Tax=Stereocaulon virgatum TaxID=373712 RepID=A0ABR3ZZB4_9LECA